MCSSDLVAVAQARSPCPQTCARASTSAPHQSPGVLHTYIQHAQLRSCWTEPPACSRGTGWRVEAEAAHPVGFPVRWRAQGMELARKAVMHALVATAGVRSRIRAIMPAVPCTLQQN